MKMCSHFDCLDSSQCEQYPNCGGCNKLFNCSDCNNQADLINGKSLPCYLIRLPEQCRSCAKRNNDNFVPDTDCTGCTVLTTPSD